MGARYDAKRLTHKHVKYLGRLVKKSICTCIRICVRDSSLIAGCKNR